MGSVDTALLEEAPEKGQGGFAALLEEAPERLPKGARPPVEALGVRDMRSVDTALLEEAPETGQEGSRSS